MTLTLWLLLLIIIGHIAWIFGVSELIDKLESLEAEAQVLRNAQDPAHHHPCCEPDSVWKREHIPVNDCGWKYGP